MTREAPAKKRLVADAALARLLQAVRNAGGDGGPTEPPALKEFILRVPMHTDYDWILLRAAWLLNRAANREQDNAIDIGG